MTVRLGILVPTHVGEPGPPEDRPVGRAALELLDDGITVVFGDRAHEGSLAGLTPRPGGWDRATDVPISAAYDRFPARLYPERYRAVLDGLGKVPVGNPPEVNALLQDKLAAQQFATGLGLTMPPVETDPERFDAALASWGAAYIKPRHGTAGRGVMRLTAGEPIPSHLHGVRIEADGAPILQRAIVPPAGWRGISVRVAAQRREDGSWLFNPPVARRSRTDWVVNADRGAEVAPATDVLPKGTIERILAICDTVCGGLGARPDGRWLLELGIDLVIDEDLQPVLIELNARPRGRLAVLAALDPDRFAMLHRSACARPLRVLAALVAAS
jgi:glutathione synthase/RimK-type ligase-like ATP-grasp enzyme